MVSDKQELYQLLSDVPDFGYFGEHDQDRWGITPIAKHRDSSILDTVNFDKITEHLLEKCEDGFDIISCGHWAVGWIEHLLVDSENEEALALLDEVVCALADYPVWDESAVSEAESEAEYQDYLNSIHGDLEKMWERDPLNIEIPVDAVWQLPKFIGQEEQYWTNSFGGRFLTELEAREDWLCESDPDDELEAHFPDWLLAEEDCFEFYRKAMGETNQYWAENDSPVVDWLYPIWRECILKAIEEHEATDPPKEA